MRKNEILEFIENSAEKEKSVKEMTEKKISEFMLFQEKTLESISTMISDLFPPEIKRLLAEYIDNKHAVVCVDNLLWIDVPYNYLRVRLNPNHYTTQVYEGKVNYMPFVPKNIYELEGCVQSFQNYIFLKKELEENIEQVYRLLCEWKEEKLNKELEFLNSLDFGNKKDTQERYKVTIIIEKVQQNELDANEKVLKVVDDALKKHGSDMISVDENEGMLDVYIVTSENSTPYMCAIAPFRRANIKDLEKELNKRHVSHCW